jgi:phospholipid transport system substrate-binding protein
MRPAVVLLLALASGGTATQALRDRDSEIRAALPPSGQTLSEAERRRVEAIVARIVDTRQMLEAALGTRWATLTANERQRLLEAFERRFRSSGGSQLDNMREARIEYLAERRQGALVVVPTRVTVRDETSEVTYSMRQTGSEWRIVDIVIDEVSTVENYRASFARVIGREGVDGLIRRLERGGETGR